MERRHKNDTSTYRELPIYGDRVKSFNMTTNLLCEYTRVQLELDTSSRWSPRRIVSARIETMRKAIDRISAMAQF
jgi:hypothetical protein